MNAEKNQLTLDLDDQKLTIRINGKLVVAYHRRDLGEPVREVLFHNIERLIIGPPSDIKESFEDRIPCFQIPNIGPCTICSRHANLLGGLCYGCFNNLEDKQA
jgi:hypothetical protein